MEQSARQAWELENNIRLVDRTRDALYFYADKDPVREEHDRKAPWRQDPHYFTTTRISAIALLKMVTHAREGGSIEIMGLMQGFVDGTSLIITDAFRLPVEGTETRVNAQDEANEYMIEYPRFAREEGSRPENIIGWYHSHPGYGCWLSGIDVGTQHNWQTYGGPFVAVVIDPDRTISAGQVEIGAFRTYPEAYTASVDGGVKPSGVATGGVGGEDDIAADGYQAVPMAKAEDFGAHANRYYSLEVEHFRSTLDEHLLAVLWNKYWVQTLSQNPLLTNREHGNAQLLALSRKIKECAAGALRNARDGGGYGMMGPGGGGGGGGEGGVGKRSVARQLDQEIERVAKASSQVASKEKAGLMAVEVKAKIFNGHGIPS